VTIGSRVFRMPSTVYFGDHAADESGREARRLDGHAALVVTDASLVAAGIVQPVLDSLAAAGLAVAIYDGVTSEPECSHVEEGLEVLRNNGCDLVVGVGGGSPIDTAKAVALLATNPGRVQDLVRPELTTQAALPIMAVPTTAGTGTEVSQYAVVTDVERAVKLVVISPFVIPQVALVDPLLTTGMSQTLTAATGLDALTHAIEAYVSAKAQPMSDAMSLSAIELLGKYLFQAWKDPLDLEARTWTMLGALHAGLAFSNSSTALVHGMTRAMGAAFHISHGVANAMLLADVMEFSLAGDPERYARIARALGADTTGLRPLEAAREGLALVRKMVHDMEVPKLSSLGVSEEELGRVAATMAKETILSGLHALNPRVATEAEITRLYYAAL
jgi:alcohol dehydrogenase class IV